MTSPTPQQLPALPQADGQSSSLDHGHFRKCNRCDLVGSRKRSGLHSKLAVYLDNRSHVFEGYLKAGALHYWIKRSPLMVVYPSQLAPDALKGQAS